MAIAKKFLVWVAPLGVALAAGCGANTSGNTNAAAGRCRRRPSSVPTLGPVPTMDDLFSVPLAQASH